MARYGARLRNKDRVIQIDDRYSNLGITQTRHVDFEATDLSRPYQGTGPYDPPIQGYPLIHSDYVTVNAGAGPHVVAVLPRTTGALFFVEPKGYSSGDYIYRISALGTNAASCRYFVFTYPDLQADTFDFRINSDHGTAFLASIPYMRVAQVINIGAGDDDYAFNVLDSGREYAFANTVFSMVNRTVYYDSRLLGEDIPHEGDHYNTQEQTVSRVRGVGMKSAGTAWSGADHTPLIAGGTKSSAQLQATAIIAIDVTGLY